MHSLAPAFPRQIRSLLCSGRDKVYLVVSIVRDPTYIASLSAAHLRRGENAPLNITTTASPTYTSSLAHNPHYPLRHYPSHIHIQTMPSSPAATRSHRQSWPPTQLRLVRSHSAKSTEPRPLLDDIDEDPLTYFLTPHHADDDDTDMLSSDDDDDAADFDAGIEVAGRPPQDWVRSVSPSTLDGLRRLRRAGAASPEFDSDGLTSDDDDYDDDVRSSPSPPPPPPPRSLAVPRGYPFGFCARSPPVARSVSAPASAAASLRGCRTPTRRDGPPRVSRPGHLWREPSADVWSIKEETEEQLLTMSETRGRFGARRGTGDEAAPVKRVRFVLPDEQ